MRNCSQYLTSDTKISIVPRFFIRYREIAILYIKIKARSTGALIPRRPGCQLHKVQVLTEVSFRVCCSVAPDADLLEKHLRALGNASTIFTTVSQTVVVECRQFCRKRSERPRMTAEVSDSRCKTVYFVLSVNFLEIEDLSTTAFCETVVKIEEALPSARRFVRACLHLEQPNNKP